MVWVLSYRQRHEFEFLQPKLLNVSVAHWHNCDTKGRCNAKVGNFLVTTLQTWWENHLSWFRGQPWFLERVEKSILLFAGCFILDIYRYTYRYTEPHSAEVCLYWRALKICSREMVKGVMVLCHYCSSSKDKWTNANEHQWKKQSWKNSVFLGFSHFHENCFIYLNVPFCPRNRLLIPGME